ncbi:MAG: hypothetical protein LUG98_10235 [Tannerellaceae bacterium]|nr:hypothetical protein [Tannerellaceae bacterium]
MAPGNNDLILPMKYCETTTLNHSLARTYPEQVEPLYDLFKAEGGPADFFGEQQAINLDKIEKELCKKKNSPDPTMDLAMGISRLPGENDVRKGRQILLVELKFRVTNPNQLRRTEIEGKITYSRQLVFSEIPICPGHVFIFSSTCLQQARRHIARLYLNKPTVRVMDAQEFKDTYF